MPDIIAQRLQDLTGLSRDAAVELASVVLGTLADQLSPPDRSTFLEKLPEAAARPDRDARGPACESPQDFACKSPRVRD